MTSDQRNKLVWATVIAYILCQLFIFRTRVQNYGGLIIVGVCAVIISAVYIKTSPNLSKGEKQIEIISAIAIIVITLYMVWRILILSGII